MTWKVSPWAARVNGLRGDGRTPRLHVAPVFRPAEPFVLASYGGSGGWTVGVKNTDTVVRPIIAFVVRITP
ncbi:hypothetical protein [Streptomyces sp. NRRL F-5123]|uniref:hypothetical protein n=1 Tax=Streptomyces sp. NRRL F-5123 TaxID=1463856 RepID=UPI0004E2803A|nr:hypothetical protein [Streptomyces sp. NRRL F-5123]